MVEISLAVKQPSTSCLGWARRNPGPFKHLMVHCAAFGIIAATTLQGFIYFTRPAIPQLAPGESVRVDRVESGGHLITLHFISARSVWCTRQVAELVSTSNARWEGEDKMGYYGLAFNQNGPGMYYGTSDDYVLYRYLPPGVPLGKWEYIVRVRHECAPWGMIHWNATLPPAEIDIP